MDSDPRRRKTPDTPHRAEAQAEMNSVNRSSASAASPAHSFVGHAALDDFPRDGRRRRRARRSAVFRRILGLFLLAMVLVMWTTANFLGSSILADNTYNKPYFICYFNTVFLSLCLIPYCIQQWFRNGNNSPASRPSPEVAGYSTFGSSTKASDSPLLYRDASPARSSHRNEASSLRMSQSILLPPLTVSETLVLALKFAPMWFIANYLSLACLAYATVASATILLATSGTFALLCGVIGGTERFTVKKLIGTVACLGGVTLIALLDYYGDQADRGSFPYKTPGEIALGDTMAILSAAAYGIYATFLAKSVHDESRVNIFLFFGLIGVISFLFVWPGLFVLHFLHHETLGLPPTDKVWDVLIANALLSDIADVFWGLAVLVTSPVVVTVGLSLSIPISLVGQKLVQTKSSTPLYWLGAIIVVVSFILVNYETEQKLPAQVIETDEEI